MPDNELLYQISLTLIPKIGDITGKKLVAYCGGPEAVFSEKKSALRKIPGIGETTINNIVGHNAFQRAEEEINFIQKNGIDVLFFTHPDYPARLLNCEDGPLLLYYRGTANLNQKKILAVVGTRRATNYGKHQCREIIESFRDKDVLIVSGLAYGIDACAHRSALEFGMETIGVLGHGLDRLYPAQNRKIAESMLEQGGLLTEFMSFSKPDRENFPRRNRIVAGMSDATLVIESDKKGGALITADIAFSYNRDVFALPGRVGDDLSRGCHFLIKTNRAALIESGGDLSQMMGWESVSPGKKEQPELFVQLSADETKVLEIIRQSGEISIDKLTLACEMPTSKISAALLSLEFEGLVQSLPGKLYKV